MNLFARSATLLFSLALAVAIPAVRAQAPAGAAQGQAQSAIFSKEELEQLVAPIALYPDALVAQILMASTYPLDVVSAARWSKANPNVKDKALEDAMQGQNWDPSVKSLTAFPQVLQMMNDKLEMTQKLGDAFLAQQKDVLDAVQRLRGRADQAGNLKSGNEQTVTKAQEGGTTVIKIEPTNPQTIYVPTYSPAVYGSWPYPAYPPYYYPYPPGAGFFAFTTGAIVGAALWGGCNWGGGSVNVNVNKYNNFNRTNIQNGNWNHNPENRKGVGYRDQASQQKYGGGQRGGADSREQFRGRAEQGRQDISRGGADEFKGRGGERPSAGTSDRGGGMGERGGGDRGGADRGGGRGGDFGGGDRGGGGFQGMDRGGGGARADSARGASSRQSMGGGGGARAGGGGGGARAGGGGSGGRGGGGGGRGGRR